MSNPKLEQAKARIMKMLSARDRLTRASGGHAKHEAMAEAHALRTILKAPSEAIPEDVMMRSQDVACENEVLQAQLAEAQRIIGLQAAALDVWKRAHPDEDGTRLAALAAAKEKPA